MKQYWFYIAIGIIFLLLIGKKFLLPKAGNSIPINEIENIDFSDSGNVLLDVRTPQEFTQGHIPKAQNMDVKSSFSQQIQSLDKDKHYYIYCKSGMRSQMAYQLMKKAGFENITNLSGGISAYSGEVK